MKNLLRCTCLILLMIMCLSSCKHDASPSDPLSEQSPHIRSTPKSNPFDKFDSTDSAGVSPTWDGMRQEDSIPYGWIDVGQLRPSIVMDLRYATTDNFVETKLYTCPRCMLRAPVALALAKAHDLLRAQGLGLKMYDCYRPQPVQEQLWEVLPDPRYVTNPTRGSMHGRGAAVDLTIVDSTGRELDMGTDFDYFGERAYHTFPKLSATVKENRRMLISAMGRAGFRHIRTEWWHYAYREEEFQLAGWLWRCP